MANDLLLRELTASLDRLVGHDGPVIADEREAAVVEARYWLARARRQVNHPADAPRSITLG
jgi:hypothetical protein